MTLEEKAASTLYLYGMKIEGYLSTIMPLKWDAEGRPIAWCPAGIDVHIHDDRVDVVQPNRGWTITISADPLSLDDTDPIGRPMYHMTGRFPAAEIGYDENLDRPVDRQWSGTRLDDHLEIIKYWVDNYRGMAAGVDSSMTKAQITDDAVQYDSFHTGKPVPWDEYKSIIFGLT